MVRMNDGALAYFPGEWNWSTRSNASYHANRAGIGKVSTSARNGVLFIWPRSIPRWKRSPTAARVLRISDSIQQAKRDVAAAIGATR